MKERKNHEVACDKYYKQEKPLAPVKILPKIESLATDQCQISSNIIRDRQKPNTPPQISILDEAVEMAGVCICSHLRNLLKTYHSKVIHYLGYFKNGIENFLLHFLLKLLHFENSKNSPISTASIDPISFL